MFGVLLAVGIFFFGSYLLLHYLSSVNTSFSDREIIYRTKVISSPQIKKRTLQVFVDVSEKSDGYRFIPFTAKAILYFPNEKSVLSLREGDVLWVSCRLSQPPDNGNPDAFCYGRYLYRKGIGGTGFVRSGNWKLVGHEDDVSFSALALGCREKILNLYRSFHWQKDVFAVVSALTVGYKDELSTDIRETYSVAGASHVLALSGLHIGFLYVLFLFLFRPLGKSRTISCVRGCIIIVLLWSFAFFTGLSPSVVRSVIMFSLFAVAEALGRESFSMNTLSAAAFFMILISPEWLFDVGFQLSFSAVASLILFYPYIERLIRPRTKIGVRLWQMTAVSLSAQIGTAPLVAYYFSRFSVHFLLSGFVVIPMASVIMYLAVALLIAVSCGFLQTFLATVLQFAVQFLNAFLHWVERLPYASIDRISIYLVEVLLFYLILVCLLSFFSSRRLRHAYAVLIGVFFLTLIHDVCRYKDRPRNSIAIYNVRSCPAVHCISSDRNSWIVCTDSMSDTSDLQKIMQPHFDRMHLKSYETVSGDYHNDRLSLKSGILSYGSVCLAIVNDNRWRYQRAKQRFDLDYLYICKGYHGKAEELFSVFNVRKVILDSSLSDWHRQDILSFCHSAKIPSVSLQEGYFQINL